jgi:hypothetical protein
VLSCNELLDEHIFPRNLHNSRPYCCNKYVYINEQEEVKELHKDYIYKVRWCIVCTCINGASQILDTRSPWRLKIAL